jgi:hypothetical protein
MPTPVLGQMHLEQPDLVGRGRVGRALQPGRETLVGAQVALLAGEPALASYDVLDHALAKLIDRAINRHGEVLPE